MQNDQSSDKNRMYDYTSLDTFLQCRKKFYYRMRRHLEPRSVAPALEFGKAIHSALEVFYSNIKEGRSRTTALDLSIKKFREEYKDREGDELRTVINGVKLLRGYEEVYRNEPFKILAIETGFAVPIDNLDEDGNCSTCGFAKGTTDSCNICLAPYTIILCGRLDTLIDWQGSLYVLEHKTTSVLNSKYFLHFDLNMQVDGYIYGAQETMGRKCLGAIINALEVWKDVKRITPKTKKMEDHYARDPKSRSEKELSSFLKEIPQIVRDIETCDARDDGSGKVFYKNKGNCMSYNNKCPYWDLCIYGENARVIERDYQESKWVPWTADHKEEKKDV